MSTSANGPGGLGHSSDEGVLGSAAQLIRVAAQSPGVVSFLFGGIITFVCVVRKIGAYEFQFVGSRNLDLGVGLTFVLIGIVWSWCSARANRRKIEEAHRKLQEIGPDRELPPEAYDLDFMMKVFYLGMPPAFVKRVHSEVASTGPAAEDILYSKRFVRFQDQSGSSTISIAGAPISSNNYSVDGIPITDFSNRAVIIPSLEAVEEVKVQSNTYDAEIGRTSGGMFNTTLRSGSSANTMPLKGVDFSPRL